MLTLGLPLMQFGFGLPDAFHLGYGGESGTATSWHGIFEVSQHTPAPRGHPG